MKTQRFLNLPTVQKRLAELGFNQSRIADELKVSREAVSKWFNRENQPSAGKLLKLAKLLKLTFDDILTVEYVGEPQIDFRKNGTAKTSEEDKESAINMGNALEKLIPYFDLDITTKPPVLLHPQNNYDYMSEVVEKLRIDMGFAKDVLQVNDIVSIFYKYNSVIIPVLWKSNKRHANALRIFLQDSLTTWVYLNLNTKIYDFKFWMAHELGHVLAPDLKGKEAELFADNFAGALLFPRKQTECLYNEIVKENLERNQIAMIIDKAKEFVISPLSVYMQVCFYAAGNNKPKIEFVDPNYVFKFNSRFNSFFPTVAVSVFKKEHPGAEEYIRFVDEKFKPPFFANLKNYLVEKSLSPIFIQNLLDVSFLDAQNIYHAL